MKKERRWKRSKEFILIQSNRAVISVAFLRHKKISFLEIYSHLLYILVNTMKPLKKLTDRVTSLPRGGYLLDSPSGYIQFGAPPETIKVVNGLKEVYDCRLTAADSHKMLEAEQ